MHVCTLVQYLIRTQWDSWLRTMCLVSSTQQRLEGRPQWSQVGPTSSTAAYQTPQHSFIMSNKKMPYSLSGDSTWGRSCAGLNAQWCKVFAHIKYRKSKQNSSCLNVCSSAGPGSVLYRLRIIVYDQKEQLLHSK